VRLGREHQRDVPRTEKKRLVTSAGVISQYRGRRARMWDHQSSSACCQNHCQQKTEKTLHDTLLTLSGIRSQNIVELR